MDKIHANHDLLATGFLGTPYLLEELTKAGYAKLAYTLLLNTQYPSWGYMVMHGYFESPSSTARAKCPRWVPRVMPVNMPVAPASQ